MKKKTITNYICSTCNKESVAKQVIEDCEKAHKCEHLKSTYVMELSDTTLYIIQKCANCGVNIEYASLWITVQEPNVMKDIFKFIKENYPNYCFREWI